jgi:hypothetical protein
VLVDKKTRIKSLETVGVVRDNAVIGSCEVLVGRQAGWRATPVLSLANRVLSSLVSFLGSVRHCSTLPKTLPPRAFQMVNSVHRKMKRPTAQSQLILGHGIVELKRRMKLAFDCHHGSRFHARALYSG